MNGDPPVQAWLASPPGHGGVAIIEVIAAHAAALDGVLAALAPGRPPAPGQWAARRLGDLDDGAIARIHDRHAQLMPHGGPAIVRGLADALQAAGVAWRTAPPPDVRPEAIDEFEALALDVLSRAASPAAIDALLRQPAAWRASSGPVTEEERVRSRRLDRLVTPPLVACVGAPNAGKSSLLNALARTEAAIVSAIPGTTRDRVSKRIELAGVVVEWIDTPGLRETDDAIERAAIDLSLPAIREAVLVVHLTSRDTADAVLPAALAPEEGVLRVMNKLDLDLDGSNDDARPGHDLAISATTGVGIVDLAHAIRRRIIRDEDLAFNGRWAFHHRLRDDAACIEGTGRS